MAEQEQEPMNQAKSGPKLRPRQSISGYIDSEPFLKEGGAMIRTCGWLSAG